jgi:hypothetical protein
MQEPTAIAIIVSEHVVPGTDISSTPAKDATQRTHTLQLLLLPSSAATAIQKAFKRNPTCLHGQTARHSFADTCTAYLGVW